MPLGNDVSGTEKKVPTEEVDDEFVCDSDELLPFLHIQGFISSSNSQS